MFQMRSTITMFALLAAVAASSIAQTFEAPFTFSLSVSRSDRSSDSRSPTAKVIGYGLGDFTGSAIVAPLKSVQASRLRSARRYAPLSLPPEFSDDYDYDPFPIFPLPRSALHAPTALEAFVSPTWTPDI
jgi:hypothetical protein